MRVVTAIIAASVAASAFAKLPPATDEAKALAAETAAKSAWTEKVALYQLCVVQDKIAEAYRRNLKAAGKEVPAAVVTAACSNPGAYASPITPVGSKPLEASGAHSPPGAAISPPSTKATTAEIADGIKK